MSVLRIGSLTEALERVKELGRLTGDVRIGDITFRLRCLNTVENKQKNAYLANVTEDMEDMPDSMVMFSTYTFFSSQKIETLAWAIVGLDGAGFDEVNLVGVEYLETDERLDNGSYKVVEKHVYLRHLLEEMGNAAVDVLYDKYIEILTSSEEEARKHVSFRSAEDELETLELRRSELLEALGRTEEEPVTVEGEEKSDPVDIEAVRDHFRAPLTDEEAAARYDLQQEVKRQLDQEPQESQVSSDHPDEAFEAGGATFIRLDDPEKPYTDEEQEYFAEQEKLWRLRENSEGPPPEGTFQEQPQTTHTQAEETAAMIAKRRRQPLNQDPIQVQSGTLPESGRTFVRRSAIDPAGLELAEGQTLGDAEHLGRSPFERQQQNQVNPKPQGTTNPNYRPKK